MSLVTSPAKLLCLGSALLALVVSGCEKTNAFVPSPPPEVQVAKPLKQAVTQYWDFTGSTASVDTVQLKARVTGYLHQVHFKDGATVKAGDLLFTIEQDPFRIALDQAQANHRKAEAAYALSVADLARVETLVKKNVTTEADLDSKIAERDSNKAQIEAEKAAVDRAQLDLRYTEIRSPINGRVGRRMVDVGNLVLAQETLLTTVEAYDPVYAYFNVSERDLLEFRDERVKKSQEPDHTEPVPLQMGLLTDKGYPYAGFSDYSDPGVDASTGTYLVRGTFPNPDGAILPGLFVRIRAPHKVMPDALLIPDVALGSDQEGKFLLTVGADNKVERKSVSIGTKVGEMRVIESGISADDSVIIVGLQRAQPGSPVQPKVIELTAPAAELTGWPAPEAGTAQGAISGPAGTTSISQPQPPVVQSQAIIPEKAVEAVSNGI